MNSVLFFGGFSMLDKMFTDSPYVYLMYVRRGKPENHYSDSFFEFVSVLSPADLLHYLNRQYDKIVYGVTITEKVGKVLILHTTTKRKYAIVRISIRELAGF
ncbi:hypothetical protein LCGC14_2970150 [marine sediment metagenome]|uniref:Uncharacterized protein n=1 Tax=marine sediment metagenome TaxID=412755 RepID=A0A0F9A0V9_9ZZZZ